MKLLRATGAGMMAAVLLVPAAQGQTLSDPNQAAGNIAYHVVKKCIGGDIDLHYVFPAADIDFSHLTNCMLC